MSREKPAPRRERPQGGGSYVRDPKSGKLKQIEGTKPAEVGNGAPAIAEAPAQATDTPPAGDTQQEG